MDLLAVVASTLAGAAAGSLLTRAIWRVPQRDVALPRADTCHRCGAPIALRDALPLVSWVALRGRCRSCGGRIALWVPVVEVGTPVLFAATALAFGPDPALVPYLMLAASFLALSVVDLRLRLLPNRIIYPTGFAAGPLLVVAALLRGEPARIAGGAAAGGVVFALFFLLHLVRPDGMAFGDVRLSFLVGMAVGWLAPSLVPLALLVAFLASSVVGVVYGAVTRRWLKATIPFGPFLAGGAELAILLHGTVRSPWAL